ncbi:MAG TPA: prolyl oligopeptidase family serine peptidase [Candidatus Hydrogenedens sp.]|nr:S9 family peptidase [Candidatus Hydrogenedens sp.]HOK08371.1 prolyl oligopeptidase family serine peptidase [Candidatus Hydrogenedens sp.]HOL20579.1 prolyl oligopeptidase family serine peptidase [Candidatus Hydrogenedens sp.]HPP57665.1 prolyl oligopeptidase family serine peptidase [Candidatus Hydrogenedens sp.]
MSYLKTFCIGWIVYCFVVMFVNADELDWKVLSKYDSAIKPNEMMKTYLNQQAEEYLKKSKDESSYFPEKESIESYKKEKRELLWNLLGGRPEPTPLNPKIIRTGQKKTYRYEVLHFESRPNFYVTSVLYLPLSPPPYSAVLIPCGHSLEAKGYKEYQKLGILLAQNGISALIYDPPGQGERITFIKDNGEPDIWGTTEHTVLGLGCILLGTNYAQYEIWDGIRAVDYIQSRNDIRKEKIGCSGNSGGGTQTAYLMAIEPRIYASAPSCYLTSWERLLNTIGPQDAEQNIFSQIKYGLDHSMYLFLHAPNPVLICCATRDFFDISGTWNTFREAKRLYTKLGVNPLCDLIEINEEHGLKKITREEIVERMLWWLDGIHKEVEEQIDDSEILNKDEYQVCSEGNVKTIPNNRSILDINREQEKVFSKEREQFWNTSTLEQKQAKVSELINAPLWKDVSQPEIIEFSKCKSKEFPNAVSIIPFIIKPEEKIVLPGILFESTKSPERVIIYTNPEGKQSEPDRINDWLKQKINVFAVDLRGSGETLPTPSNNDITRTVGLGWEDVFRAYLIGKSYVGMRVVDYFSIIKYVKTKYKDNVKINIDASGVLCVPAIHAVFLLLPNEISMTLRGLTSWKQIIDNPRIQGQITNAVHDALKWYDIPQLISTIDSTRINILASEVPTF